MAGRGNSRAQRLVSPGHTTPAPASGPTLPLDGLRSRGPSLHSKKRTPGPCSPGGRQAQMGSQTKWGAPSQEDKGFPVRQRDEGSCPRTARSAPPGEAGGGPRRRPSADHCPPAQKRSSVGSTAGTKRERGALTSLPTLQRRRPCPDLRMAQEGRGRPHAQAQLAPQP